MTQGNFETYEQLLNEGKTEFPLLEEVLERANRNRIKRLRQYRDGVRVKGIEQLLSHLNDLEGLFQTQETLKELRFLLTRAIGEFEVAIEATLSGMYSVMGDTMRGVMEIEFLFRDFYFVPQNIQLWLTSAEKRKTMFQPNHLRQRHAIRVGQKVENLTDHTDYKAHSESLHVTPLKQIMSTGISVKEEFPFQGDACFWEIFEHARRLLMILHKFAEQYLDDSVEIPNLEELHDFRDAWQSTQQMQAMFLALLQGSANKSTTDKNGAK